MHVLATNGGYSNCFYSHIVVSLLIIQKKLVDSLFTKDTDNREISQASNITITLLF